MNNAIRNAEDLTRAFEEKKELGGAVFLPAGEYPVRTSVLMDTPSLRLAGEVWAYNLDPNGVFETRYGSKLRLYGKDHPALSVGSRDLPAGIVISDIGLQGDIVGMDTRGTFDRERPYASAGLYFGGERVDQGDFSKISCCGLAVGVSIAENSEIDACDFRKINVDGCNVGFYFAPRATYYTRFYRCIVGDTPSYGFFADGEKTKNMGCTSIVDTHFVRNCGDNHIRGEEQAAVYLKQVKHITFRDNLIHSPGEFWYFAPDATQNDQKTKIKNPAVGLFLIGKRNQILNNVFEASSRESMIIKGDENVLMGNIADSDVVIQGRQNVVNGLVFTKPEARLILVGEAAESTSVLGVEPHRIVKRG